MSKNKGIIYIMTTSVSGLIKIGKTDTKSFYQRMRTLEQNGYYNVSGLKRFFAIEVEDYSEKEKLLNEIFSKHRVKNSELFALDCNLVKQLLLSFEGEIIYPEKISDKEEEFEKITKKRKQGEKFTFYKKGLKNGDIITFIDDPKIKAKIVSDREVEYQGKIYKLSPLVREIYKMKGKLNKSGAYQGAYYWTYQGTRLTKLPDV